MTLSARHGTAARLGVAQGQIGAPPPISMPMR